MNYSNFIKLCDQCTNIFKAENDVLIKGIKEAGADKIGNNFCIYNNFFNNQTFLAIDDKNDPNRLLIFIYVSLGNSWVHILNNDDYISLIELQSKELSDKIKKNNLFKSSL